MLMMTFMKFSLYLLIILLIAGCNLQNFPLSPSVVPTLPLATFTQTPIPPTPLPPTDTPTATASATSTSTPTPVWVFQSGTITCPILLYHRMEIPPAPNSIAARYYAAPADFRWQMQALKDWGYTTIPMSLLVEAIMKGSPLPPRPVVISFDDGYETVYQNAFPIMKEMGFTGIMYLVGTYVGANGYMDASQVKEMTTVGWEVGSHSMTHPHLPTVEDQIGYEAGHSKTFLESKIGVNVETFAYPYGEIDEFVVGKVAEYGYFAAVGLGTQYVNSLG